MDRNQLLHLLREFGGSTTDIILDNSTKIFTLPDVKGFIGYRTDSHCLVAYGDPVAPPRDQLKLAQAFHNFAKEQGKSFLYLGASKEFSDWALDNGCKGKIEFGKELQLDPSNDPRETTGKLGVLVRKKVKHAQKENVSVDEYTGQDPELEAEMGQVFDKWLAHHTGPSLHLSNVHLFTDRMGKRWFFSKWGGHVVGLVVLNQVKAQDGWFLNHLMITPEAPKGTSELLVVSVLEKLRQEGCRFVTAGLVPDDKLGEIKGLGSISALFARSIYQIIRKKYRLGGLSVFWEKFQPDGKKAYLLCSRNSLGLKELLSLKKTLNG